MLSFPRDEYWPASTTFSWGEWTQWTNESITTNTEHSEIGKIIKFGCETQACKMWKI